MSITGRKKDLIITSSGKNITPVNIESALRESRYITEAVVFGDNRPYLVALLTLDRDEAAKLAARLGIEADPATSPATRGSARRSSRMSTPSTRSLRGSSRSSASRSSTTTSARPTAS